MVALLLGAKKLEIEIFYIFATYIQIIIRIMKNLVEKINAEYEVFVSNANAQVEKGNKGSRNPRTQGRSGIEQADEGVPEGFRRSFEISLLLF